MMRRRTRGVENEMKSLDRLSDRAIRLNIGKKTMISLRLEGSRGRGRGLQIGYRWDVSRFVKLIGS